MSFQLSKFVDKLEPNNQSCDVSGKYCYNNLVEDTIEEVDDENIIEESIFCEDIFKSIKQFRKLKKNQNQAKNKKFFD